MIPLHAPDAPASHQLRRPPRPRGAFFLGSLFDLTADPQGYLARCTLQHGNVVQLPLPWPLKPWVVVNDAHLIKRVFIDEADAFRKGRNQRRAAPVLGNGVLLAEGEAWKRQRRIVNPAFQRAKVGSYVASVRRYAQALTEDWLRGGERDVGRDMVRLTLRVAAETMFGAVLGSDVERIASTVERGFAISEASARGGLPSLSLPFAKASLILRTARVLRSTLARFIAERRRTGEERGDLLSMLLKARDEDGSGLTDPQIRDEAITAFVGGSETTAVALSWTFYLLARHPETASRLRAELAEVVGDQDVQGDHLPSLGLLDRVIKESLRLYPPIWRIHREATRDVELGGFLIPRGTQVITCPYLMQRDPAHFKEPDRFQPDRWTEEFTRLLPKFAYFPFGGGQRICVGANFALTEIALVIASVLPRVRFEAPEDSPALTRTSSILRPQGSIRLRVTAAKA